MGLQQYKLVHCSDACTISLGQSDEHPRSAVKRPFIGLVETLAAVIKWQKHFRSVQSLYGNKISRQACRFART